LQSLPQEAPLSQIVLKLITDLSTIRTRILGLVGSTTAIVCWGDSRKSDRDWSFPTWGGQPQSLWGQLDEFSHSRGYRGMKEKEDEMKPTDSNKN
jgi:hypothetical protein